MEPEAIINAFLEVIKNQSELFEEKVLQDLPELELVIERLEYEEDDEKVELAADYRKEEGTGQQLCQGSWLWGSTTSSSS